MGSSNFYYRPKNPIPQSDWIVLWSLKNPKNWSKSTQIWLKRQKNFYGCHILLPVDIFKSFGPTFRKFLITSQNRHFNEWQEGILSFWNLNHWSTQDKMWLKIIPRKYSLWSMISTVNIIPKCLYEIPKFGLSAKNASPKSGGRVFSSL